MFSPTTIVIALIVIALMYKFWLDHRAKIEENKQFHLQQLAEIEVEFADDDIEWVVNDNAELGIKVNGKFYWLYKGQSMEYFLNEHDDGTKIKYRRVGKREFGENCHPISMALANKGSLGDHETYTEGSGWKECE